MTKVLVSSCLMGINCKYNGKNNLNIKVLKFCKDKTVILVCPEVLGGLKIPRVPSEIYNSNGDEVIKGNAKVVNKDSLDVTQNFIRGADAVLTTAKSNSIKLAILKSKSPSCGKGIIYDGTFQGKLKKGDGVTTAKLKKHNIKVITEEDLC